MKIKFGFNSFHLFLISLLQFDILNTCQWDKDGGCILIVCLRVLGIDIFSIKLYNKTYHWMLAAEEQLYKYELEIALLGLWVLIYYKKIAKPIISKKFKKKQKRMK